MPAERENGTTRANAHKLALLHILRYLLERTDEAHPANATELGRYLAANGLPEDRRTIYTDVAILADFGLDVVVAEGGKNGGYYVASRDFELPELKLLVDAVQSSKFITERKSTELIGKLSRLTSAASAKQLVREVYVRNRAKTDNENIFYNIDSIYEAIHEDVQIAFQYGTITPAKQLVARRDGARYQVSPWALIWDDDSYYLIAYDDIAEKIKFFRVDRMLRVRLTKEKREGASHFADFDPAAFSKKMFGMYGGKDAQVTLRCEDRLASVIIDRFGMDVTIIPGKDGFFRAMMPVSVSPQFFGWVTGIGTGLVIESPSSVREEYLRYLRDVSAQYR